MSKVSCSDIAKMLIKLNPLRKPASTPGLIPPTGFNCTAVGVNNCGKLVREPSTFCSQSCWLDFESAQPRKDIKRGAPLVEVK